MSLRRVWLAASMMGVFHSAVVHEGFGHGLMTAPMTGNHRTSSSPRRSPAPDGALSGAQRSDGRRADAASRTGLMYMRRKGRGAPQRWRAGGSRVPRLQGGARP